MNNSSHISTEWMTKLSTRINLLNINIPYVPLLLKDIPTYIESNDYESNRIKTIQTIGHMHRKGNIKIVDINQKGVELPVCLDSLPITEIYFKVPRNNCNSIWEYNVVKVYGTLIQKDSKVILDVSHIFQVRDFINCEKVLTTFSLLARKGYHQFSSSEEVDRLLDIQWKKIGDV
ncbi:hypothetical protein KPH14_004740 [Odynerus spinipes]|uniref:Uncharacterized protein n=1 Tax=Odynerus spinipes TaxID=1348599 RepID=A0AAD9RMW2_9HYME|nr:hypothetical protein KPH14_004740 [Odynerus spinipes]